MAILLERIKKRPDFLRVAALRRKWATAGLILQVAPSRELPKASADESLVGFGLSGGRGLAEGLGLVDLGLSGEPVLSGAGDPISDRTAPDQADGAGFTPVSLATGTARVGFTTSKKVGNAVARNRARRRLRAAVAEIFPRYALPGHDYVVIGRTETVTRDYSLLLQDLKTALKRVGAYRSDKPRTEQQKADRPPSAKPEVKTIEGMGEGRRESGQTTNK